ncbi:MAG: ABC transporter ATP-binding protein [Ilumatobacteraceae bacterium]
MSAVEVAASVDHLSKKFRVFHERHQSLKQALLNRRRGAYQEFAALDDVTFDVHKGETFAVVGHNGSGKSTLLKCLTNILRPDGGSVTVHGNISALLELGAGFHPELSGRENVFLNAAILGVPRKEIAAKFDEIVAFAELERFIDQPVKNYSSGMYVRLGFAVAVNVDPDVLIVDEVLAVGDASFQAKCMNKIEEFRDKGRTIILVTHSLESAATISQRVAWLDHGHLKMIGSPDEVIAAYAESQLGQAAAKVLPSGEVEIQHVELVDHLGQPIEHTSTGQASTVRVRLRRTSGIAACRVTLVLRGHGGGVLAHTTSPTLEPHDDGTFEAAYSIGSLPLLAGSYSLFVDVHSPDRERLLAHGTDPLVVDVIPGEDGDEGLVSLGGIWS